MIHGTKNTLVKISSQCWKGGYQMCTSATKALLRVSNATTGAAAAVEFLWFDDQQGREIQYALLCPGQVYTQQTYVNHRWIVRSNGRMESFAVTDRESTVVVTTSDDGALEVTLLGTSLEPLHRILCSSHPRWGQYVCRTTIHGIPVCSYSLAVTDDAVVKAVEILCGMLEDVSDLAQTQQMIRRMVHLGVEVAIIGRDQTTTDIPAHAHLKGKHIHNSSRSFEHDTRGLGATVACPVMSCPEENLLQLNDVVVVESPHPWKQKRRRLDRYPYESILVHEFAHTVMNLGLLDTELHTHILESYQAAMRNNLYEKTSYVASNPQEYWAEMSQAWFHATLRKDVTSGITTRETLMQHDPRLSAVMCKVWGHGSWRFYKDDQDSSLPNERFNLCKCM